MITGKRELTAEDRELVARLKAENAKRGKGKVVSQSFVDRMTSASADPDAVKADVPTEEELQIFGIQNSQSKP